MSSISSGLQPIHGFHDWFEKFCKARDYQFQFGVKWISKDFVVQIPHQVDEAPLLRAADGIIRGVKIGYQDTLEPCQKLLDHFPFAVVREDVRNLTVAGQNPDKSAFPLDVRPRFVRMYELPLNLESSRSPR